MFCFHDGWLISLSPIFAVLTCVFIMYPVSMTYCRYMRVDILIQTTPGIAIQTEVLYTKFSLFMIYG